jgi:hypothetical protein
MTEDDIAAGLAGRLISAALGYPVAWANMDDDTTLTAPFLTFQVVRTNRTAPLISSAATISQGYAQINCVIAQGGSDRKAVQMADEVISTFPPRTKIAITGGEIEILDTDVNVGFQSDAHWVQPLRVSYRALPRN